MCKVSSGEALIGNGQVQEMARYNDGHVQEMARYNDGQVQEWPVAKIDTSANMALSL